MILKALDPRNRQDRKNKDMNLMLADFIKIFKTNKVSDSLLNIIQRETKERLKMNQQAVPVSELPDRRLDHPSITDPHQDLGNRLNQRAKNAHLRMRLNDLSHGQKKTSKRHLSIMMKDTEANAIVEFPIQSMRGDKQIEEDEMNPSFNQ